MESCHTKMVMSHYGIFLSMTDTAIIPERFLQKCSLGIRDKNNLTIMIQIAKTYNNLKNKQEVKSVTTIVSAEENNSQCSLCDVSYHHSYLSI